MDVPGPVVVTANRRASPVPTPIAPAVAIVVISALEKRLDGEDESIGAGYWG